MKNKKWLWLGLLVATACLLFYNRPVKNTHFALDTVMVVDIYGQSPYATRRLLKESFALCDSYEQQLSATIPGSLVDKLNNGEKVTLPPDIVPLFEAAQTYAKLSNGAFDPTIKPLAEVWDIRITQTNIPQPQAIQQALGLVGYENLHVEGDQAWLEPGTKIDFGGIAKGFIADKMQEHLQGQGVESALLNLGGNVVALGERPKTGPWKVGVQKPFSDSGALSAVVSVADTTVVTSGTYQRFFMKDGKTYHHILDPKTGFPAESGLASVTIVTPSATHADALSTACFVLGLEKGMALLATLDDTEGIFITGKGDIKTTPGLAGAVEILND